MASDHQPGPQVLRPLAVGHAVTSIGFAVYAGATAPG